MNRRMQITELIIPRNKLAKIDIAQILTAFPNLERLDLSQNLIDELLPETYQQADIVSPNLKRLLMSRNLIRDLRPLCKVCLPHLEVLTLFGNYIDVETSDQQVLLDYLSA